MQGLDGRLASCFSFSLSRALNRDCCKDLCCCCFASRVLFLLKTEVFEENWYLDDDTIYGNLELLEQVLLRLEQCLPRIGLELNLRKCVLVSSTQPESRTFPRLAEVAYVDVRDESQGFKVIGVPMGGSIYVKKLSRRLQRKWHIVANKSWNLSAHKRASSFCVVEPVVWSTCLERLTPRSHIL